MKTKDKKTVILGAGLAGLAAGYELAKAGIKTVVVEKSPQVGGLAKTIKIDNFSFDTGPHRWYTKSTMINKWMLKLMGNELIRVTRLTRIYFDGKYFYYPIKLMNALVGIGPWKAFMAIVDYFTARMKAKIFHPALLNMEDGYINQFGRTLYEVFFRRYSEKLWGEDCRNISIDWVGQRTRGLSIFTIIKETVFKSKDIVSLVDEFSFPKKGIGRISERMREEIRRLGGEVIIDAEVMKINHDNNKILSIDIKHNKKIITVDGDNFISSIPLNDLIKRLTPKVDKKIIDLADNLRFRDGILIVLLIKKSHITQDTWIYVHPKNIPFMRMMEMDNWSKHLSPPGTTTMVFEVACSEGDKIWRKNDKEIIKLIISSYISEFKLIKKEDIIGTYVHRVSKEYPVYHLNYKEDVGILKDYLGHFANLQLIGRNGTFRYNNMDHSIEMGLYAAWNTIAGKKKYDIESVNIEREYLEEKRLENIEDETLEKPQSST